MFTIWYTLFSTFYLIAIVLHFFFCKILKFNNNIFTILFTKIDYLFNFYNTQNNSINLSNFKNSQVTALNFKNFYQEYQYFYTKNIKLSSKKNYFENTSIFCNLNNLINRNLPYSIDLNYVAYLSSDLIKNNKINNRKTNLNFFFNKVTTINKTNTFNLDVTTIYSFTTKKLNNSKNKLVEVSKKLSDSINSNWTIKFSPSNFIKYINYLNVNTYSILYLRKSKVFNKGRYSRNRQYYRTGVYWCLYVNIIAVVGIYFWFYRFTMNFGYLWWLLFAFICSFIIPKAIKYRLYNPINLINSIAGDLLWIGSLLLSFNSILQILFSKLIIFFNNYFLNLKFFNLNVSKSFLKYFMNFYLTFLQLKNLNFINLKHHSIYTWEFNYTNYYYSSVLQSRPVFFEKTKHYFLRLLNIVLK